MAEANGTPSIGMPTILGGAAGSQTNPQPSIQPTQQADGQGDRGFGGVDPAKLPADVKPLYDSMLADYTRKTQEIAKERGSWTEKENKYNTLEQQFKDLNTKVQHYTQQEQIWRQWAPFLQNVSRPGIMEKVQAVLEGREAPQSQGQPGARTGEQTVNKLLSGIGADDFVTGASLSDAMTQIREALAPEIMGQTQRQMEQYANMAVKSIMDWVQNYQTLADQAASLRLQHEFGLTPKEGRNFSLEKVVQTAKDYGITDLAAAYQLAYGREEAQRLAETVNARSAEERKQIEQEAYERGKREERLALHNSSQGFLPGEGAHLPEFKASKAIGYNDAERKLQERLAGIGLRSS